MRSIVPDSVRPFPNDEAKGSKVQENKAEVWAQRKREKSDPLSPIDPGLYISVYGRRDRIKARTGLFIWGEGNTTLDRATFEWLSSCRKLTYHLSHSQVFTARLVSRCFRKPSRDVIIKRTVYISNQYYILVSTLIIASSSPLPSTAISLSLTALDILLLVNKNLRSQFHFQAAENPNPNAA